MDVNKPVSSNTSTEKPALPAVSTEPLSSETVQINTAALKAFSADGRRNILCVENSTLQKPTGFAWAISYSSAKQDLKILQTTVQQTVDAVLIPCEEQLHQWQNDPFAEESEVKGLNNAQPLTLTTVTQMESKLNEAKEMLVGIRNLYKNLKWQYSKYAPDTPQRQAISALKETLKTSSKKMIADNLLLEHVKSKLQNQEANVREHSAERVTKISTHSLPTSTQSKQSSSPVEQTQNPGQVAKIAALVRALEKKSTQADQRDLQVYVTTNECGVEEVRQQLLAQSSHDGTGGHIGFSSTHNFDIMCARHSAFGLICDFNPQNTQFIKEILNTLRVNPNMTREQFIKKMSSFIQCQMFAHAAEVEKGAKVHTKSISFSTNFNFDDCDPRTELEHASQMEGSWLKNDHSFNFIKKLAIENRIGVINADITDTRTFNSIKTLIDDNGFHVDSLYLTNIRNYMNKENSESYNRTVTTLAGQNGLVIDATSPSPEEYALDSNNGPRQRLVRGAEAAHIH